MSPYGLLLQVSNDLGGLRRLAVPLRHGLGSLLLTRCQRSVASGVCRDQA